MVFGGGAVNPVNVKGPPYDVSRSLAPVDPAKETLELNADTFWSGVPRDGNNLNARNYLEPVRRAVLDEKDYHKADGLCQKMQGLFAEAYQPVGCLHVDCAHDGEVAEYRRELDLSTAQASVSYSAGGVRFERTMFSSAPDQVLVTRISSSEAGHLNADIWLDGPLLHSVHSPSKSRLSMTAKAASHIAGAGHADSEIPVQFSEAPGEGMYSAVVLDAAVEGGELSQSGNRLMVRGAQSCTIVLAAATGYRSFDQIPDTAEEVVLANAARQLNTALQRSYSELRSRHIEDHRRLFDRMSFTLGAPVRRSTNRSARERLCTVSRSIAAGPLFSVWTLPSHLQFSAGHATGQSAGHLERPGCSRRGVRNWTANINLQMNYWPAETCNLGDCAEPLFALISDLSQTGSRAAQETYGLPGWVPITTSMYGERPIPSVWAWAKPTWANWCMSGPWLCSHLYDHYRFTRDREFLRTQAYPLMKGSAEFCLAWLIDDGERPSHYLPIGVHGERFYGSGWQARHDQRRLHHGHGSHPRALYQLHPRFAAAWNRPGVCRQAGRRNATA